MRCFDDACSPSYPCSHVTIAIIAVRLGLAHSVLVGNADALGPVLMPHTPRRSLTLIAVYAVFCVSWIAFAQWIAPTIITQGYKGPALSVLNWILSDRGFNSGQHHVDRWAVFAGAVPLAAVLHLAVVLLIERFGRRQEVVAHDRQRQNSRVDAILILVSAVFLAATIISGVRGDYEQYLAEWMEVLAGNDPWNPLAPSFNAYGPLFNVLAFPVWLNPLANKLLFAFSYLVYVIWLIEDFWLRRGLAPLSWQWVTFWLLFPFPWIEISYLGFFDCLVALSCVAAVHARVKNRDVVAGISIALGILLKYIPIVILPFLALDGQRFRSRLLISCVACVVLGLLSSTLIWGTSTFTPLFAAATRHPVFSVYQLLEVNHSPIRWFWVSPHVDWLEKPLLLAAVTFLFLWCMDHRPQPALAAALAILLTLMFYRVGLNNYQMVLFYLISYWAVSEWERLRGNRALVTLLGSYFCLLGIIDLAFWTGFWYVYYTDMLMVLFKFATGCIIVVALIQFPSRASNQPV
jgi:hypothetical protein